MKHKRSRSGAATFGLLLLVAVCGCGDSRDRADGGSETDASVGPDADVEDAALPDAIVQDGSVPDGALEDGGGADGGPYPIMMAASTYANPQYHTGLFPHRPYVVYAWCSDPALDRPYDVYAQEIGVLESINDSLVEKMIMFSSNITLNDKLSDPTHVQHLHNIGVTTIGYNSEGGLTPSEEMNELNNSNPSVNPVARFAATADSHGFDTIWGPIRVTADNVSDQAILAMFGAGLDGVGLQEQQFINHACVDDRATAVQATAARYRNLAGSQTIHVNVQIMPSTCLDGDTFAQDNQAQCGPASPTRFFHCASFVDAIVPYVDSIAIWAMGTDRDDLAELVGVLRQ